MTQDHLSQGIERYNELMKLSREAAKYGKIVQANDYKRLAGVVRILWDLPVPGE